MAIWSLLTRIKTPPQSGIFIERSKAVAGAPCSCCGGITTTLTRFVHLNGAAHAIYYATFSDKHPDRTASSIVSIGPWGEGSSPGQRRAFAMMLWSTAEQNNVHVLDAQGSFWADAAILGNKLSRTEALAHPLLQQVYDITDAMFAQDCELIAYLQAGSSTRD